MPTPTTVGVWRVISAQCFYLLQPYLSSSVFDDTALYEAERASGLSNVSTIRSSVRLVTLHPIS
jgi:hypothetical protein